jgi:hypothetical protein
MDYIILLQRDEERVEMLDHIFHDQERAQDVADEIAEKENCETLVQEITIH